MRERRGFVRVPLGLEVRYQSSEESMLGMSIDLSRDGMRMSQPDRLEVGRELWVNLALPTHGEVSFRGIVIWCGKKEGREQGLYETGLRWVEMDQPVKARLNTFLDERIQPGESVFGIGSHLTGQVIPSYAAPVNWWRRITLMVILVAGTVFLVKFWFPAH